MEHKLSDKRLEKGEQARTRIISAAIEIISENGIKELSAAKLAKATAMSKSNIFHHFKSIDEILLEVLNIIFQELLEPLTLEYKNLEEFLNIIGQSSYNVPEEYLKVFKAFFSFYHEGMFNVEYKKTLASCTDQITNLIYKQLKRLSPGDSTEETLYSAATIILSMMDGMGLHYLLKGDSSKYYEAWNIQTKLLHQLLSNH